MRILFVCALLIFSAISPAAFALESPSLKTTDSYSRVIIPIENGANFHLLSDGSNSVRIQLERTRLEHLSEYLALNDKRVAKVGASRTGLDNGEIKLTFQGNNLESFAYMQPSPPAVVIDVWEKKVDVSAKLAVSAAVKPRIEKMKTAVTPKRTIASAEPKVRAPESVRPLDGKRDIFTKFSVPMPELTFSEERFSLPPRLDVEKWWEFTKPKSKPGEISEAYLFAQKLYEKGKFGLCIRTIEIAFRDQPNNIYANEMQLLMAFAYKRLGETSKTQALVKKADDLLKGLALKVDEDGHFLPFHRTILVYFANKSYLASRWFDAIDQFEGLGIGMSSTAKEFPYLQMILADLYGRVEQPRRAERIYRFLQEHFKNHVMGKEAAYRKVSLLALEKNYDRVVEEAGITLRSFRDYESTRPEVVFELGEANFWRHDYAAARKAYSHFIQLIPSHTLSAEAHVRLGEIAEIVDHDLAKAKNEYLAAKNGFPFSHGDRVASLRLARLLLPEEKDLDFQIHSLTEIRNDEHSDAQMKQIAELLLVDYYCKQGAVDAAIDVARSGMVATVEGAPNALFKEAYINSLFKQLQVLNQTHKFADALKLYEKEKQWLDQYGPEVFRVIAESYRGVGLVATSNSYLQKYINERSKSRHPASETAASDRALRIERASNAIAQLRYAEVLSELGNDESDIVALNLQATARFGLRQWSEAEKAADKGLAMLSKRETVPKDVVENFGNILIARDERERDYERMLTDVEKVSDLLPEKEDRFEFAHADALWYLRRHKEASSAYVAAISAFPKSERVERAKYNLGMSYIALGKSDDAVKTLTDLRDKSQTLWAQSAKQELELIDWEKKYSSVLKSLPPTGLGITN